MHCIKMVVCLSRSLIGYHFVRRTLETHTFVATGAQHLVASINLHDWHFASRIGTVPSTIFQQIFLKVLIRLSHSCNIFTPDTRMVCFLYNK